MSTSCTYMYIVSNFPGILSAYDNDFYAINATIRKYLLGLTITRDMTFAAGHALHPLKPIIHTITNHSPKLQVEIPKFMKMALNDMELPNRQKSNLKLPPGVVAFKKNMIIFTDQPGTGLVTTLFSDEEWKKFRIFHLSAASCSAMGRMAFIKSLLQDDIPTGFRIMEVPFQEHNVSQAIAQVDRQGQPYGVHVLYLCSGDLEMEKSVYDQGDFRIGTWQKLQAKPKGAPQWRFNWSKDTGKL
ncbi:hypothetical protein B0T25DRAFT_563143 [Lasiosphaeria hispida]|uniref:Uncharacterized protein n=1 Tax=Lasiosphaeria hispida TaxID=260671 RepID=A0AAJ0HWD9_9PEZI|nr:hypothetical protein B0T25DRAFT_563143 [Lasiosphaeria hispida]